MARRRSEYWEAHARKCREYLDEGISVILPFCFRFCLRLFGVQVLVPLRFGGAVTEDFDISSWLNGYFDCHKKFKMFYLECLLTFFRRSHFLRTIIPSPTRRSPTRTPSRTRHHKFSCSLLAIFSIHSPRIVVTFDFTCLIFVNYGFCSYSLLRHSRYF